MAPTPAARLTFLLDPELKQQFEEVCAAQDITPSQVMRQLLKAHVAAHAPARKAPRPPVAGRHRK
jgi:antitoxin component of RelBE/YafQ-DinJ toxin-antitoxin module